MTTEQAMLKRVRQNDEAALAELYEHYGPRIYTYIYRRVGDPCLTEDLVGDVFVRVIQAIHSRRLWHTSFRGWLFRIAHNVVVDHCRQQQPILSDSLGQAWAPERGSNPDISVADALENERLKKALRRLTPSQQQVLVLRLGQGLTVRETAHVLQKTTGSIKAIQYRALASLRRMLGAESPAQDSS